MGSGDPSSYPQGSLRQCNDIRSQDVRPEYMRFSTSLDLSPVDYQPNTGPRLGFVSKDCGIRCVGFGPGLLDSVICRSRGASLSLFTGPAAVPPSKTMDAPCTRSVQRESGEATEYDQPSIFKSPSDSSAELPLLISLRVNIACPACPPSLYSNLHQLNFLFDKRRPWSSTKRSYSNSLVHVGGFVIGICRYECHDARVSCSVAIEMHAVNDLRNICD
jgi:hypothetical protein